MSNAELVERFEELEEMSTEGILEVTTYRDFSQKLRTSYDNQEITRKEFLVLIELSCHLKCVG